MVVRIIIYSRNKYFIFYFEISSSIRLNISSIDIWKYTSLLKAERIFHAAHKYWILETHYQNAIKDALKIFFVFCLLIHNLIC